MKIFFHFTLLRSRTVVAHPKSEIAMSTLVGDGGNDNMPPQSSGHDDHNNGDDNGHNGHNGHNGGGGEDSGNANEVKLYIGNLDYGAFDY